MVISTLNMEQMYIREDRQRRRRNDDKQETEKDAEDVEMKNGEGDSQVSYNTPYTQPLY